MEDTKNEFTERVATARKDLEELLQKHKMEITATIEWTPYGAIPKLRFIDTSEEEKKAE